MATINLSIPDAVMPRVIDALCTYGGYDALVMPNGQTKPTRAQFAKNVVISYVMSVTRDYEAGRDAQAAQVAARTKVDSEILIT